jgi:hypothetical protein
MPINPISKQAGKARKNQLTMVRKRMQCMSFYMQQLRIQFFLTETQLKIIIIFAYKSERACVRENKSKRHEEKAPEKT